MVTFNIKFELILTQLQATLYNCATFERQHMPPVFRQTCVPKNNLHDAFSKDDVNTPSAILCAEGDNFYISHVYA